MVKHRVIRRNSGLRETLLPRGALCRGRANSHCGRAGGIMLVPFMPVAPGRARLPFPQRKRDRRSTRKSADFQGGPRHSVSCGATEAGISGLFSRANVVELRRRAVTTLVFFTLRKA